jgi:hypothetical protein
MMSELCVARNMSARGVMSEKRKGIQTKTNVMKNRDILPPLSNFWGVFSALPFESLDICLIKIKSPLIGFNRNEHLNSCEENEHYVCRYVYGSLRRSREK